MYRAVIIALVFSLNANAVTESAKSGRWGDQSTWSNGIVPTAADSVLIKGNHNISLSQQTNICDRLCVKGLLHCASPGRTLISTTIELLDSGSFTSGVLGNVIVDSLYIKGENQFSGFNLQVKEILKVENSITYRRTSGNIEIKNLKISLGGMWSVPDNQSFTIKGCFENNGDIKSGTGKYFFVGQNTLKGSSPIVLSNLLFSDTLNNQGHLKIIESAVAPDSAIFINESVGVLEIKTTNSKFAVKQLDLTSIGNVLIFSRGTKQHLPHSKDNEYYNVSVLNGGELIIDFGIDLLSEILIDTASVLSINAVVKAKRNSSLIIKDKAVLRFSNDLSNDFLLFVKSLNVISIGVSTSVILSSDVDFILPVLKYSNIELVSNVSIDVKSEGDQVVRSTLKLGKDVVFNVVNQRVTLKGNAEGPGKFNMSNSSVLYAGNLGQKILTSNYDTLIIDNNSQDTSFAVGAFEVSFFYLKKGVISLGALTAMELTIEEKGKALIGSGNFETSKLLRNKGCFEIISNSAHCTFKGSLVNTGVFHNKSSSSHILSCDVFNDGVFNGCTGTGCTWELARSVKVNGSAIVYIPRLKFNKSDTLINTGHISVSNSIKGSGHVVNSVGAHFYLGMDSDQNESSLNAWEHAGNTVVFNKNGDQQVFESDSYGYQNLVLSNNGVKRLVKNVIINSNLTIDTSATFTVGSNVLSVTPNSKLYLKLNSLLVLGSSVSSVPIIFPPNFKSLNIFLHKTSTVSYESLGDQTISTIPIYGNLLIKDGAINQSIKKIGQGDTLDVRGDLGVLESSIQLVAENIVIAVHGNWNGPADMSLNNSVLFLYGNANSSGDLKIKVSSVHYVGAKDQLMKNTLYYKLIINKPSGQAIVKAGKGIFTVSQAMDVQNGKVQVGGEHFEIMNSLVLNDTLYFKSRAQHKILNNVQVISNGFLDNSYGVDIEVKGSIDSKGIWRNGRGSTIYFNIDSPQRISSTQLITFDKLVLNSSLGHQSIIMRGEFSVKDSLILDKVSLKLDSTTVTLLDGSNLIGESEQNQIIGTGSSAVVADVNLVTANNENIAGLGFSVYADSSLGVGKLIRGFNAELLQNNTLSVKKTFLLELVDSNQHPFQMSLRYFDYEISAFDESLLTLYYDASYSGIFRLGLSTSHSRFNKIAYAGVKSGTKVTVGEIDLNPLPVNLISFDATLNTIANSTEIVKLKWEVSSEVNTDKYLLFVSEDGINFTSVSELKWKSNLSGTNNYSFDHVVKNEPTQLYYKLYEQDLFGGINYLGIDSILRDGLVSAVQVNGQTMMFSTLTSQSTFGLYSLDGRLIITSKGPVIVTSEFEKQQICVLCAHNLHNVECKKLYLR